MPRKRNRLGPVKLKNRPDKSAFIIANKDKTPMVLESIQIIKDPTSNKFYVDLEYADPEEYELKRKKKINANAQHTKTNKNDNLREGSKGSDKKGS